MFKTPEEAAAFYEEIVAAEGIGDQGPRDQVTDGEDMDEEEYYCEWCGTGFVYKYELEDHEDECTKRKQWMCSEYGERRISNVASAWPCDRCQEVFDSKYSLARHYLSGPCRATGAAGDLTGEDAVWDGGANNRRRTRSRTELEDLVLELEDEQANAEERAKEEPGPSGKSTEEADIAQGDGGSTAAQVAIKAGTPASEPLNEVRSDPPSMQSNEKPPKRSKRSQHTTQIRGKGRVTVINKRTASDEAIVPMCSVECIVLENSFNGVDFYCLRWSDGRHTWHAQAKIKCPRLVHEFVELSPEVRAARAQTAPKEVSFDPLDTIEPPKCQKEASTALSGI